MKKLHKANHNIMSDRNEIILDYVDITNKTIVANTDTAFIDSDGNTQTNTDEEELDDIRKDIGQWKYNSGM